MYLDDNVIVSKKSIEHIAYTKMFLTRLKEAGVAMRLKKCALTTNYIDYLGHVIKPLSTRSR